jgi:hypothetical protein
MKNVPDRPDGGFIGDTGADGLPLPYPPYPQPEPFWRKALLVALGAVSGAIASGAIQYLLTHWPPF